MSDYFEDADDFDSLTEEELREIARDIAQELVENVNWFTVAGHESLDGVSELDKAHVFELVTNSVVTLEEVD